MNKIYKVIWSKVKNCYVVASELAKSHTKAPKLGVISRFIGVGMLSCILSSTVMPSVFSAALSLGGGKANGVNTIAIGQNTIANPGGSSTNNNAFAIGMGYAENHSIIMDTYTYGTSSNGWVGAAYDYSVAIGYGNTAGIKRNSSNNFVHTDGYDLALGGQNYAIGGHSTAIGFQSKASGEYATALGLQATASGSISFAVDGTASGSYSIAIGRNSDASASSAIALGYGSVADVADTVSVGSSSKKRKIVNIANGTAANDAATYGQISGTIKGLSVSGRTITYTKVDGTTGTITTQDNNTTYGAATDSALGLVKTGSNITNSSGTISLTKANVVAALGYTPPTADTNTTYANMKAATASAAGTAGLVPAPAAGKQNAFLRGDGTWVVPTDTNTTYGAATGSALGLVKTGANITNSSGTISLTKANVVAALGYTPPTADTNTTYGNMKAATASAAGTAGLVPAPAAGKQTAFLRGDGTWVVPTDTNTTYSAVTQSANGLMTAADKKKLDGITAGANAYSLPTATGSVLGGVKTGANITNSSGTISLTKDNVVTALGYTPPTTDTNTTYAAMSADELITGTATSSRSITAKVLGDYVKNKTNDKISNLSINGNIITYTKGDGTTGTITTPNTTYSAGSGLTLSGTTLSVNTNGTATSGNTGVVSGGTLYNAIKDKVKYDSDDKSKISFGGTRGTVLSNLLGTTITADSTDAVTGSQLYAVKQDISGFAEDIGRHSENIRTLNSSVTSALSSVAASSLLVDTMDVTKADVSLNNLSESGKQVLKSYAATAVQEYIASQSSSAPMAPMGVNDFSNSLNTLTVTNAGNGSLHVGEGSYVNGTSSIAIGVGNQVNANNSGAFGDPSIIDADASYVLGNDDTINSGATGSFIVGNDGVSDAKGGLLFGSNTKATVEAENGLVLGNNTTVSAKDSIALGSNSIADIENVLSIGNNELKRKIINVADGDISQNSHEAVTGAQLYVTNEKVQQNTKALEQKADRNASNIQVEDWATKLGIGKVEDGNANLVTGGTVYQAIHDMNRNGLVQSDGDVLTIGKNNSASKIDVSTVDGQNRIIRGVDTDAYDDSSVANVGYVNAISEGIVNATNKAFQRVDTKINKVGASAAALASLPTPTFDGDEKWAFSAGVGYYRGETAASAGAFYKPQDNVIVRVGGSFGNGDEMVGAGVSVSLNKADTPAVSKAKLVRTINAQAEKINIQDNEIQNLKAGRVADNQRIAELEAQLVRLTAKVDEMNK